MGIKLNEKQRDIFLEQIVSNNMFSTYNSFIQAKHNTYDYKVLSTDFKSKRSEIMSNLEQTRLYTSCELMKIEDMSMNSFMDYAKKLNSEKKHEETSFLLGVGLSVIVCLGGAYLSSNNNNENHTQINNPYEIQITHDLNKTTGLEFVIK